MQLFVAGTVVSLLEQDVGADFRGLQLAVGVLRRGGDVHVHAADGAVFVLGAVDGLEAFQDVAQGVVGRILSCLDGQAFVAHVLQGDNLGANLLLRELAARNVAVLRVVGAVKTPVHAVVGKIERREQHNAVAVIGLLDVAGELADLGVHLRILAGQKHRGLAVSERRTVVVGRRQVCPGLFQDGTRQSGVVPMHGGIGQGVEDFLVVDEIIGARRAHFIANHRFSPS